MFRIGLAVYDIEQNGFHVLHKDSWGWDCKGDSDEFAEKSEMFLKDMEEIADSVGNIFGTMNMNMCFFPVLLDCEKGQVWKRNKESDDGNNVTKSERIVSWMSPLPFFKTWHSWVNKDEVFNFSSMYKRKVLWNSEDKKWYLYCMSTSEDWYNHLDAEYKDMSIKWNNEVTDKKIKADTLGELVQELRGNLMSLKTELNIAGYDETYRDAKESGYESCLDDVDMKLSCEIDNLLYWETKKIDFLKLVQKFIEKN